MGQKQRTDGSSRFPSPCGCGLPSHHLHHQPYCVPRFPTVPGDIPRSHILFSCHFLSSTISPFWKCTDQSLCKKCLSIWVCLTCSHDWKEIVRLGQEYHGSDAVAFSVRGVKGYMTSVCLITDDINLGHICKVVAAGFLHCKAIIFPFAVNIWRMKL